MRSRIRSVTLWKFSSGAVRAPSVSSQKNLVIAFTLFLAASAAYGEGPRRVLFIHSFGRDFTPFSEVSTSFRTKVAEHYDGYIEFLDTSLEMARFDGADRDGPLLDFISAIYSDQAPDLIIPIGAPAAFFWNRNRDSLFPDRPALVLAADKRRVPDLIEDPSVAVAGIDMKLPLLVENILQLLPQTKSVYVVSGTAPLERFWEAELRKSWATFEDRVSFNWLTEYSLNEACEVVSDLPKDAVVFISIANRDADGIPHEAGAVTRAIRSSTSVPVFGYLYPQLSDGIVGGPLDPMIEIGEIGGKMGARLLQGESTSSITPVFLPLNDPVYNSRELQRWGIPKSRLPANSSLVYEEPSLWQTHRSTVLIALAVIAAQAVLIWLLVNARKRAQKANAMLNLAANAGKIGLWQRHPGTDQFIGSRNFRSHLGLPEEGSLTLDDVAARYHPDDRDRIVAAINEAEAAGEPFQLEHRIILPEGSTRWLSVQGTTYKKNSSQEFGTLGATVDITERRSTEERDKRQQQELTHLSRVSTVGALTAALAHEINQPLASILTNAQVGKRLLANVPPDLNELEEILEEIVSEDHRANDVIKRLRSLIQRGEADPQQVDVNATLVEVLKMCRSELHMRQIRIDKRLAPNLPTVLIDKVQLQQIVLNFITNACDAMENTPAGNRVLTIETSHDENSVSLSVSDRGIGLPEDRDTLFEPFRTTKEHGLGVGLSICRTLLRTYGGKLVAGNNEHGGATFRIRLSSAARNQPKGSSSLVH